MNMVTRAAKVAIRIREAGHFRDPRKKHSEITSNFDCIPDTLDDCAAEPTPSAIFAAPITTTYMWLGGVA